MSDDPIVEDAIFQSGSPFEIAQAEAKALRKQVRRERAVLLVRSPAFMFGMAIILFWLACAVVPGLFTNADPNVQVRTADGSTIPRVSPRADAWLGTDRIGQDVLARLVYGSRNVLITAPVAAAIAVIIGAVLGLAMGYYRGWFDEAISRFIEALLSLPIILLALMVLALFGNSRTVIIATIAGLFAPVVARTVRSAVLAEVDLDYVTSAELRGERGPYIMIREILPNIMSVIVVEFTVRVGYAIFTVATLAFIGLAAADATAPDWGNDINSNFDLIQSNNTWWPTIFPAIAIASLVIGVNLVADSLQRVSDS